MEPTILGYIREKILALSKDQLLPVLALKKAVAKKFPKIAESNIYNRINKVLIEKEIAEKYEKKKGRPKDEPQVGPLRTYIRKINEIC